MKYCQVREGFPSCVPLELQKLFQNSMKPSIDLPIVITMVLINIIDGTKQLDFPKTFPIEEELRMLTQYLFRTMNIQLEEKLCSFELEGERRETAGDLVILLFSF